MVLEDYLLDKSSMFVELSYSFPDEMLKMMPHDTPPTFVTSGRQVISLMELCRTNLVRLCLSLRHIGTSGGNLSHSQHDQESVGMEREKVYGMEDDDEDDDEDGDWEAESEDLHGDTGFDGACDGNVKGEFSDEEVDYSVYGKMEDENADEANV